MSKRIVLALIWTLLAACLCHGQVAGQIGHWNFNEENGTTAADTSGMGSDGTLGGDVQWRPGEGILGGALLFTGDVSANVEIPTAGMSASAGTFMVWAFLSEPQPAQTRYFFGHTTQPSYASRIQVYMDGATDLDLGLGDSHTRQTNIVALETERWYHVALTWDQGAYAVYLDGEEIASGAYTGLTGIYDIMHIGNDGNPVSQGTEAFGVLLDEARSFNVALTQNEILRVMLSNPSQASEPAPESAATDVLRGTLLSWKPGDLAETHNVYLGTDSEDVSNAGVDDPRGVLVSQSQAGTVFDPGALDYGQTYYWRVDEVNSAPDFAVFKGEVWSFTQEPLAYPVTAVTASASSFFSETMQPANTSTGAGLDAADGHSNDAAQMWLSALGDPDPWIQYDFDRTYKLHEMWVWNQNQSAESAVGFGVKDVTMEISVDGSTWTVVEGGLQFAQAPGTPGYLANTIIPLNGLVARSVRLNIESAWGNLLPQVGLSEVRFYSIPVNARNPRPADGGAVGAIQVTLAWDAGREAERHEVLYGTDLAAVEQGGAVVATTTESQYQPVPLTYGSAYYWRINEINDASTPARNEGAVWRFSAPEYLLIDDFESYRDETPFEIWATWADGYDDRDHNGALVGTGPSGNEAETALWVDGRQSLPIFYDNSTAPMSEATRTFDPPLDWTVGAPSILSLYFRGDAPEFIEDGAGNITIGAAGADIFNTSDDFRFVYKTLRGDGTITARAHSVVLTDPFAKGGVMIRESLNADSSNAMVYLSGSNGVRFSARPSPFAASVSDTPVLDGVQQTLTGPVWIKIERIGNQFNGYYATDEAGDDWVSMSWNPQTITMAEEVKIGLAVTSHSVGVTTVAEFSDVSTTGNVTGSWTPEAIGGDHPSNDTQPLALVVADSAGHEKVFVHPDDRATVSTAWREWVNPLSELGSVDPSRIQSISIRIGTPGAAPNGAMGTAYIDALRVGTPYPVVAEDPNP